MGGCVVVVVATGEFQDLNLRMQRVRNSDGRRGGRWSVGDARHDDGGYNDGRYVYAKYNEVGDAE